MAARSHRKQVEVVRRYIAALNARDIGVIEALVGSECKFIDSLGGWIAGRDDCIEAARRFFEFAPDFSLAVETIAVHGGDVLVSGRTSAEEPMLRCDRLWRARTDGTYLLEWQSYGEGSRLPLARALMGERARPAN